MGFYVGNSANLLMPEDANFQEWYSGNVAAVPLDSTQFRFSANNQQIQNLPLTPISGYMRLLKNQTYTVGITRVSGTGTLVFGIRAYYVDDGTTFATGTTVTNTTAGRVTYTFTTPNDGRPKGIQLVATLTTGYAAGTPLIIKGATMVRGATDLGELPPTYVDTSAYGTYDLRIVLYTPNDDAYKILTNADDIEALFQLSDIGSLKFKVNQTSPETAMLTADHCEVGLEVTKDGVNWVEPFGGRFYRLNLGKNDQQDAVAGEYSFASWGWMLSKMAMNATVTLNDKGQRVFNSVTPGTILKTIIDEEKAAGVMTAMAYDFSTTVDSNGDAWANVMNIQYDPGANLLQVLQGLCNQGLIEWTTQGRTLRVFNENGNLNRDRSTYVVYKAGYEITDTPDRVSNESLISRIVGYGENNVKAVLTNPGAITPYGHFETSASVSGVADQGTISVLQQAQLDANSEVLRQRTRAVRFANAQRFPFLHYRIGDKISTFSTRDQTSPSVDRIRSITLQYSQNAGVTGNLVLNSKIEEWQIKLAKRQSALQSGMQFSGNGSPNKPNFPGQDTRTPKAPTSIVGSTAAYQDSATGAVYAAITLDWADVTQATDNTAMDITSYEVYWRAKNNTTPEEFRLITAVMNPGTVTNSYVTMSPFEPNRTFEFKIRAMASSSKTPGLFSGIYEITSGKDSTPPPVPMPVTLTTRGGTISITWNGKGVGNVAMPIDFDYAIVEVADDSFFTTGNRFVDYFYGQTTTAIADLPYNVTKFFRIKAVDQSKNESAWSATASISTAALVNTDIVGRIIAEANIALNAVNSGLLADGAVTNTKIAAGQVSTSKLTVGGVNRILDPHYVVATLNAVRQATASTPAFVTIVPASSTVANGYLQIAPTTATATEVFLNESSTDNTVRYPIELIETEKYFFEFTFTRVSGAASGGMRVTCLLSNGTTTQTTVAAFSTTDASGVLSGVFTAPAGVVGARVSFFTSATISSQRFSNPGVFIQAGATLIEDGAITTNKIVANAITATQIAANSITANELAANSVTTDKIVAGAVDAASIAADAINGKTIVGANIRTTALASGPRITMTSDGIVARNAGNGITINFDSSDGSAMISGVIRTNPQGTYPWIELNNALWPSNYLGLRFYVVSAHAVQPEVSAYRVATDGWIAGSAVMRSGAQVASGSDVVTAGRAEVILQPGGRWLIGQRLGTAYGRNYVTNTGPPGQGGSDETWVGGFGGVLLRSAGAIKIFLDNTAGTAQTLVSQWGAGSIQLIHSTLIELNDGTGAALRVGGGVIESFRWIRYGSPPSATSGTNVIMVGNLIGTASSLSKYKLDQQPIGIFYKILDLVPKTWRDRYMVTEKPNTKIRVAGLVAEDVKQLSTDNGGIFDPLLLLTDAGALQGVQYDRVVAYMLPVIKDMADRITQLETMVQALTTPPSPTPEEPNDGNGSQPATA